MRQATHAGIALREIVVFPYPKLLSKISASPNLPAASIYPLRQRISLQVNDIDGRRILEVSFPLATSKQHMNPAFIAATLHQRAF